MGGPIASGELGPPLWSGLCVGDSDNPDLLTQEKSLLLSAEGSQPVASGCCSACEGEQPGD